MTIKAFVFDIGQTLVYYPFPLNWSASYRPAFEHVARELGVFISENEYRHIVDVLGKYNTRTHPREREVSSDVIFREILAGTSLPMASLQEIKRLFYSYFSREARIYPDVEGVLAELKRRGAFVATLSDVAYGMDNAYALEDIRPLLKYIDLPYTSNDTGFRKPAGEGLRKIAADLGVDISEVALIGDERKDMECARNAGAVGILVNRSGERKEFGQDFEVADFERKGRSFFLKIADFEKKGPSLPLKIRRELHENAELSHEEHRTREILEAFFERETDFRVVRQDGWFFAVKEGLKAEEVVAFRAELDALPIPEGGRPVSHRCGHDGHMAALCGVALALKGVVPARTVCLVFQPAEEVGEGGEACARVLREELPAVLGRGAGREPAVPSTTAEKPCAGEKDATSDLPAIREIYACHNRSGYPEGSVFCCRGLTQPASEGLIISLTGEPSHASEPEKGRSPAEAISKLALMAADMNRASPMILSTVVGIRVGAGDFGISPGDGELRLTLRAENESDMKNLEATLLREAEALAKEYGLHLENEIRDYFPETRNHAGCARKVLAAAGRLGLPVCESRELWRASEDFGYYTREFPGAMFYVGNGEDYAPLHTEGYEFQDRILGKIVEMFLALI